MAIIYSYPQGTPTLADNVIGSQIDPITEENKTVQFSIAQIAQFANSSNLGYLEKSSQLTNTQALNLITTPVELIPAPGPGKYIEILSAAILFKEDLSNRDTLDFDGSIQFAIDGVGNRSFGFVTGSTIVGNKVYLIDISAGTIEENARLVLQTNSSTTAIAGFGTIETNVRYQILNQAAF